ncbi:MAG: terminase large subunit [Halanaerobiales bacterium]
MNLLITGRKRKKQIKMIDIKNNKINGEYSWFLEYYNKIKSGEIIAGHELKKQINLLVDDFYSDNYIYDTDDAEFRIEFIENFIRHTKSPFYGKPFKLTLWEKAVVEVFYSFKWTDKGYIEYYGEKPPQKHLRRFKKLILLIARKNGKSSFASALVLTELMCGNGGSDIVCSSNDDAQASIIFEETNVMREQFDPKGKRTHKNLKYIINLKNNSKIFKLSDRTKNKEGRNIDGAILDESHEMQTNIIAKSIDQSQSVKDEPWFINITTEGFVNDGYLDKELKYARSVIDGDIEDRTLLSFLYTQDSETEIYQDEESWQKSNPSLGEIKKNKYLKDQLKKAQHDKGERVFMLAKDFNIKQNNAEAWLLPEEIKNEARINLEDLIGSLGIGGIDLSETIDLTSAKVMIMKPGDPESRESQTKYFLTKYFIPEAKLDLDNKTERKEESKATIKKYIEWAKNGFIEVHPGNEIDYSKITEWYVSLYKQYNIRLFKIILDKWGANYLARELEDDVGYETEKINFNKNNVSNPMKLLEADLKSKLVNYNNNPVDVFCLSNAGIKVDNLGLVMPIKIEDSKRIDGVASKILCYYGYNKYRTEYLDLIR